MTWTKVRKKTLRHIEFQLPAWLPTGIRELNAWVLFYALCSIYRQRTWQAANTSHRSSTGWGSWIVSKRTKGLAMRKSIYERTLRNSSASCKAKDWGERNTSEAIFQGLRQVSPTDLWSEGFFYCRVSSFVYLFRHNHGHVTRSQLRQGMNTACILLSREEVFALEQRYNDELGFNYAWFIEEMEALPPNVPLYHAMLEEKKILNAEKSPPKATNDETNIVLILAKIKAKVVRERIGASPMSYTETMCARFRSRQINKTKCCPSRKYMFKKCCICPLYDDSKTTFSLVL